MGCGLELDVRFSFIQNVSIVEKFSAFGYWKFKVCLDFNLEVQNYDLGSNYKRQISSKL